MQENNVKTTSIRMPKDLVDWLNERAKENYRNFSFEVIKILEEKRKESAKA
ncbi:Arc family DNA-binding protein [Acinetobacter sp. B10A]|uniref:Arc family DNA-binding protein n=1 Tax=Acinetobacter baretiae TaxID=2605383 RepID=UPI001B3C74F6|nr:Arc family DNA-binding protein [Acinetobacter baretiae]MBF7685958.1 Arc family DNA-binding protein [Acinetobacter baretiae]